MSLNRHLAHRLVPLVVACFALIGPMAAKSLAAEAALRFALPIDCTPGTDCWIPNYVDTDPGPGARDYAGGSRTYQKHKGVDIAIRDYREMQRGVAVLAAADGVVAGGRDNMPDVDFKTRDPAYLKGKECGNGVVIQHTKIWRTQYCHMKRGSIAVKKGQKVRAGTQIGQVGLSGRTEFPHVHFMIFRQGKYVDPFTGAAPGEPVTPGATLWQENVRALMPYRATNIYHAGFAISKPTATAARRGDYQKPTLQSPFESLFLWMDIFGVHNADLVTMRLLGPKGQTLVERKTNLKMKRPQARKFLATRIKHPGGRWPAGIYRSQLSITRNGPNGVQTYRADRRVTIR
ncbi:MAG: M23 family metallopeptidase [Rhodospirillales bacterium]|nr:M23 family metallopeptidase [Rhodospirillales bacterium]